MSVPRFLADEDLRQDIVDATRRQATGMQFQRVTELGLKSAPDSQVLEFAARAGLLVVSHDVNTMSAAAKDRIEDDQPMSGYSSSRRIAIPAPSQEACTSSGRRPMRRNGRGESFICPYRRAAGAGAAMV